MYFFRSSRVSMRFLTCQCQSFHSSSVTLGNRILPVSYTHLTLPTICSV